MKYSKQRELILETVLQNRIHPTADDVYALIRQKLPNISLGTVYRNLNLLAQNGDILKISVPNGSDRFDGCTQPHFHMICSECKTVLDVELPEWKSLEESIFEQTGFAVSRCELLFYGTCKECSKKQGH
jgi:Fe2+ or Zn2+ uptake regulation protein